MTGNRDGARDLSLAELERSIVGEATRPLSMMIIGVYAVCIVRRVRYGDGASRDEGRATCGGHVHSYQWELLSDSQLSMPELSRIPNC